MMAPTDEVIAVAEALRAAGGIYVTHMRDEANDVLQLDRGDAEDRPRGRRAGGDQPPQMLDAGEFRPLASRPCRASTRRRARRRSISTSIPIPPAPPC